MSVVWRKSSRSDGSSSADHCVEVAALSPGVIGIRDSKNVEGPHFSVSDDVFGRLIRQLKGQY